MKHKYQDHIWHILIFLLSAIFMLFFSSSTSPLYKNVNGVDSAFYRFIGSFILKGKTPYLDIWENKGPVLYFIQAIGALNGLQNRKLSVLFLMQVVSLFITLLFIEGSDSIIASSSPKNHKLRFFLLSICSLLMLSGTLEAGNLSEEWSLPMISCSLFFFTKYAVRIGKFSKSGSAEPAQIQHPKKYAFIHGICFALTVLIRINNATSIITGLFLIMVFLVMNKQWKNLFENILSGLSGAAIVVIPVFLWYLSRHALNEMIYASFLHGFKYAKTFGHIDFSSQNPVLSFIPLFFCGLLFLLHLIRGKKLRPIDIFALTVVCTNAIMLLSQNIYNHYFTILFPVFFFSLVLYTDFSRIPDIIIAALLFILFIPQCNTVLQFNRENNKESIYPTADLYIPKSERDNMIAIDILPEIYLLKGMVPCSRFASFQSRLFEMEPDFKEEFVDSLKASRPNWIMTVCFANIYDDIQKIIDDDYRVNFTDHGFCFYRRIDIDD